MNTVKNKVTGGGIAPFRSLTEDKVEESTLIPKVQAKKDFNEYIKKLKAANVATYYVNNPPKPADDKEQEKKGKKKI